jgi:hypothetical protein
MNKEEKRTHIYLLHFLDYLENIVKPTLESGLYDKNEAHALKTSTTWLKKIIFSVLDKVDVKTRDSIIKIVSANTLELLPTKEMLKKVDTILTDKERIETLAEAALYKCINCDGKNKTCQLKKVLLEVMIPPFDDTVDKCCYKNDVAKCN